MGSNVTIESDTPGSGELASRGCGVVVRLKGSLRRGDIFMQERQESFRVGEREVIAGLEQGVQGMRVGGRRRICVPPHLGYGEEGIQHKVPPCALLFFDLELLEVYD